MSMPIMRTGTAPYPAPRREERGGRGRRAQNIQNIKRRVSFPVAYIQGIFGREWFAKTSATQNIDVNKKRTRQSPIWGCCYFLTARLTAGGSPLRPLHLHCLGVTRVSPPSPSPLFLLCGLSFRTVLVLAVMNPQQNG